MFGKNAKAIFPALRVALIIPIVATSRAVTPIALPKHILIGQLLPDIFRQ